VEHGVRFLAFRPRPAAELDAADARVRGEDLLVVSTYDVVYRVTDQYGPNWLSAV
jgi:hypothetical protein